MKQKKKIKKKDLNGKNVLSRPQAKQTWVPFPLAIYQIGTWIGADTMALVKVAPQVNSRFNEITFVSSKIIQRTAASWERWSQRVEQAHIQGQKDTREIPRR